MVPNYNNDYESDFIANKTLADSLYCFLICLKLWHKMFCLVSLYVAYSRKFNYSSNHKRDVCLQVETPSTHIWIHIWRILNYYAGKVSNGNSYLSCGISVSIEIIIKTKKSLYIYRNRRSMTFQPWTVMNWHSYKANKISFSS